ncbi:MAG TPA: tRNA (adenosine(37)-N6)-threonylcarbamoyltransferase complex dimerization subunit type 1 TsaB [Gemmatimonadales bacterium]|nr:tRNA (adenosine(37)-N6)-threonylcarbamoyltransferase complex dimerization subunit type 1 TsaB [Gemmatimonadales bacterium]
MKPGRWLAIDTATDLASVAVGVPPGAEAGAFVQGSRRHAAEIIELADHALDQAGLGGGARDLAGIVIADGPGSFTGLRIGWAAAKGLAHAAGLPLRAVPSLMAAAAAVARQLGPVPVAACYDALRGQVYGALYVVRAEGVETLVAPAVMTVADFARIAPVRPRAVVGDGAMRYPEDVLRWSGAAPLPLESLIPNAVTLLSLFTHEGAARALDDSPPLGAEPVYGRPAEAQALWEARHGQPLPDSSRSGD